MKRKNGRGKGGRGRTPLDPPPTPLVSRRRRRQDSANPRHTRAHSRLHSVNYHLVKEKKMKIQLRTNEITLRRPIQNKKKEGGGEGRRKEKKEHLGKGGEGG